MTKKINNLNLQEMKLKFVTVVAIWENKKFFGGCDGYCSTCYVDGKREISLLKVGKTYEFKEIIEKVDQKGELKFECKGKPKEISKNPKPDFLVKCHAIIVCDNKIMLLKNRNSKKFIETKFKLKYKDKEGFLKSVKENAKLFLKKELNFLNAKDMEDDSSVFTKSEDIKTNLKLKNEYFGDEFKEYSKIFEEALELSNLENNEFYALPGGSFNKKNLSPCELCLKEILEETNIKIEIPKDQEKNSKEFPDPSGLGKEKVFLFEIDTLPEITLKEHEKFEMMTIEEASKRNPIVKKYYEKN